MSRRALTAGLSGLILLAAAGTARGYINPNFTPVHLVEKADLVLLLRIAPADDKGRARGEVVKVLKGKADRAQTFDLTRSANAEHAKAVREMIRSNGGGPALLFVGKGEKDEPSSKLHIGGKWASLDKAGAADTWDVDVIDSHMEGTWAGGTDMLLTLTELLIRFPDTDVPVAGSGRWEDVIKIEEKVAGKVSAARAVDLAGNGKFALFVASDGGDKVVAYDEKAKKFADVTGKLKLASKSRAFAWADLNGDGKLDLASSDGKALAVWTQGADGAFVSTAVAEVPKEECVGLAALDLGAKGRAGLVWTGKTGAPTLLVPDKGKAGVFALKPLAVAAGAVKDPAGPGGCLVADFDGDTLADIIQPYAKCSAFYKGKGGAEFAEGVACAVALGDGKTGAFLGDWDADGRPDVFTVAEDSPRLWQNTGGGKFVDYFAISGELTYISKPGCIGGNACDFNADGRQDVFLLYPEMGPQLFFNRGYRSFGHAHRPIDLAETGNLPEALGGAQAGAVADFNGDGAQDMTLVLSDGAVCLLQLVPAAEGIPAVRVSLSAGGAHCGPITVWAENDRRPLGAWSISPGTDEALFCRAGAGEVTVTWQLPGGQPQKKTFMLEDKPVRFVIGAGK